MPLYGQSREQRPLLKKMDQLRYYDLKVLKGSRIYEDSRWAAEAQTHSQGFPFLLGGAN